MGRSPRGQRAYRRLHNSRGKNVNILLAVDDTQVVHWKSVVGSCKEAFVDFFTELSTKLGEQNVTIYLDNAPSHRKVSNFINVRQNHIIKRFDAAYSPELNPVEGCFNVIKSFIKSQVRGSDPQNDFAAASSEGKTLVRYREEKLVSLVEPAINNITREHLRNFYRHVDQWILKATNSIPFTGQPWFL